MDGGEDKQLEMQTMLACVPQTAGVTPCFTSTFDGNVRRKRPWLLSLHSNIFDRKKKQKTKKKQTYVTTRQDSDNKMQCFDSVKATSIISPEKDKKNKQKANLLSVH